MTINELIDLLEDLRTDGYGEVEITGAMQPNYPLEASVTLNASEDEDGKRVSITAEACGGYAARRDFEGDYMSETIA